VSAERSKTLLASRLDDRSILFGKLLAALAYGWGLTLLSFGLGAATVSVAYGQGHVMLYPLSIGVSVLSLALLGGLFVAVLGILISLHAPTVRQAYQRLSIALLLVFIPIFSTQYLPVDLRSALVPTEQNWFFIELVAGLALAIVDGWLLALCIGRFRRPRLMAK
jgi:ABC-2 type transport system permease protein